MTDFGTVGNTDKWTAVFKDANGIPADPDGPVTWTITRAGSETRIEQPLEAKVGTGTFELRYTPERAIGYTVKASATVEGVKQSTPATNRSVKV